MRETDALDLTHLSGRLDMRTGGQREDEEDGHREGVVKDCSFVAPFVAAS